LLETARRILEQTFTARSGTTLEQSKKILVANAAEGTADHAR
jgi:hypothetical protein